MIHVKDAIYVRGAGLMVGLSLLTGCASSNPTGWALRVGNSGAEPIRDVRVTLESGRSQSISRIASQGVSSDMQLGPVTPTGAIQVSWLGSSGSNFVETVSLTNRTEQRAGRVVLDIKDGRSMRMFVQDYDGQFLEEIPWGNSADWDGTVAFPVGDE
jgi:hypothetical protein